MNYAIILAGGKGTRFGNKKVSKQFVELTGVPMIVYSMRCAQINANIDSICVAADASEHDKIRGWAEQYGMSKLEYFADPGETRQGTVYSALSAIPANNRDTVNIMTSVCPFVSQKTLNELYKMLDKYDATITVVKATDAITFSNDGRRVNRTLQKQKVYIQQGPQVFRYGVLMAAHKYYVENLDIQRVEVTEDSELVLNIGVECAMVHGDRFCIKVTYPEDLAIAESLHNLFERKELEYARLSDKRDY